jgi:hypothetical protein
MNSILSVLLILTLPVVAAAQDAQGLMDKVNNRYVGDDALSEVTLEYTSKSGSSKEYQLRIWNIEESAGNKTLLKYTAPNFMRGSGVLVHGEDKQETLQWLYLSQAAKKEARKISSSERGRPLFGTDIFYVDIEAKATEDFTYQQLRDEVLDGIATAVVQAVPNKSDYPYERTISWVDPERLLELKVEYYQDGKLLKTLIAEQTEQIEGVWTVTRSKVVNVKQGSSTVMNIDKIDYNLGLQVDQFSFKALTAREI